MIFFIYCAVTLKNIVIFCRIYNSYYIYFPSTLLSDKRMFATFIV